MSNAETALTLDEAVAEVLGLLTGLDLTYDPQLDRYRAITRQLNRALRANALELEWSYYADQISVGESIAGQRDIRLSSSIRPRVLGDDAVQLVDDEGVVMVWAYFLPRDALPKYTAKDGLWCAYTRQTIVFNRQLTDSEAGFDILVPVMREPVRIRLPEIGEEVPDSIRNQEIDFFYPDLVIARAAYFYAQTDPVMQPRVQTLEDNYKTLMYQVIEREQRNTDSPYINEYILPLENGLIHQDTSHFHPHSNFG